MWLANIWVEIDTEIHSNIVEIPSWYQFMDQCNQETYSKIDNIISMYRKQGFDTLEFVYKLRSDEELRLHFWNVNNIWEEDLKSLFNDTFLPIQKKVKEPSKNVKSAAKKILELRKRRETMDSIKNYLSWKITLHDKLISRCEYLCLKHYSISLEEFWLVLNTMDYDQQTKWLLKHTIVMSNVENIWKNLSKNHPDLDRKLRSINMDKYKNT